MKTLGYTDELHDLEIKIQKKKKYLEAKHFQELEAKWIKSTFEKLTSQVSIVNEFMGINSLSRSVCYLERMIEFPCSLSKIHFYAMEQNKYILG